ncbi:hypothetical protein V6N11_027702 [Hibiscus sabdariffa]|uniref:Uncharacterized protein n=2 Tax=Hibiscus sabdariffa TaxID=183260 RepID=A0ABR1ZTX2_9ROSI
MASLWHSEGTTKENLICPSSEDNQWLELGLGFSINSSKKQQDEHHQVQPPNNPNIAVPFPVSASAASSHLKAKHKPPGCSSSSSKGLELGLGLGLDHGEDDDDDMVWRNQHEDHYGDGDDDYDDMAWWWACHMNNVSSGSLKMPVPNNLHLHDYSTRTRPHSGLWFTLQAYTNRNGEALPQIPKAYIRVKDENVTIFMVKKYLVRKLGLSNEAEVEISCMGQRLLQTQTLKQVRDGVWLPSFLHNYSLESNCVNNHLMSLYYGRRCAFN